MMEIKPINSLSSSASSVTDEDDSDKMSDGMMNREQHDLFIEEYFRKQYQNEYAKSLSTKL